MIEKNEENQILKNLIAYAKDYVGIINPARSRYKIFTESLKPQTLDLSILHSLENGNTHQIIDLPEYYSYTTKELDSLDEDIKDRYLEQKQIATKIEEIINKYDVNEYTKQINLNFGYFTAEYEIDEEAEEIEVDKGVTQPSLLDQVSLQDTSTNNETENRGSLETRKETFPLFSIPISIIRDHQKYYVELLEDKIILNIGSIQEILREEDYYAYLDYVNKKELEGNLNLPFTTDTIDDLWKELKAKLRLSDVIFDDDSFDYNYSIISLSSKSNYFLAQDLAKLAELEHDDLIGTSLGGWLEKGGSDTSTETSKVSEGELFFPFESNKYQRNILRLLNQKAAIVEGPPGTGKSQSIANVLCHLAANDKKVLFLSQKPQALKVVKDKLKTLDIDYLYGYIPDKYSTIYDDDDEADSAASTLAGINNVLSEYEKHINGNPDSEKIERIAEKFSEYIDIERRYYELDQRRIELQEYDIGSNNVVATLKNISLEYYKKLLQREKNINEMINFNKDFSGNTEKLTDYNRKFSHVDFSNSYSGTLTNAINIIGNKFYDRKNPIQRFIKNKVVLLQFGLPKEASELPREVIEEVEYLVLQDISKNKLMSELSTLREFLIFKEYGLLIPQEQDEFKEMLNTVGLDLNSYEKLKKLCEKNTVDTTLEKVSDYYRIAQEIKELKANNPNEINKLLASEKLSYHTKVKHFIKNRIRNNLKIKLQEQSIRGIIARISRALSKSKRAYKTFDKLKQDPDNFKTLSQLIPVWIMSLEDASRVIPAQTNMFDYVILDEASQCNLAYVIPAMYRTKHILLIGDSEQMRDDSISFKSNKILKRIADKNQIPDHLQIKSEGDSVKSVLDIGYLSGFSQETLLNHYRSPKELIGFSNKYFYEVKGKKLNVINTNYLPYKDTNRVMVTHIIKPDRKNDISSKTNLAEVNYINELVLDLKSDPKTRDYSIGVLTFFNEQAELLSEHIEDSEIKISSIEGIQGDERDIIIYSLVITDPNEKNRYLPLTGEGGDIRAPINAGRVNVAFSRARLQVHIVSSLEKDSWPDGIWIKKYLEYAEENGQINFFSQELRPFDSYFEEEVHYFLLNNFPSEKFILQNQVESCGFKLDFVITDIETNKKVAIECDGPTHFESEESGIYVQSDIERQAILESAGWTFVRIPYSSWIEGDHDSFIIELDQLLGKEKASHSHNTQDSTNQIAKNTQKDSNTRIQDVEKDSAAKSITSLKATNLNKQTKNPRTVKDKKKSRSNRNTEAYAFKEVFEIRGDNKSYVVSETEDGTGIWINEKIVSNGQEIFTNHGIGFNKKDSEKFQESIIATIQDSQERNIPWFNSKSSVLRIHMPDENTVDLRKYINTNSYTGFTKKGIRLPADIIISLLKELMDKVTQ